MNAQNTNLSTRRKRFAWLCALSPIVELFITGTMAVHIRLGFGYWPAQGLKSLPAWDLQLHNSLFVTGMFFTVFALIHLIVTLIHHRELGVRLRWCAALLLVYLTGCALHLMVIANVPGRFVNWLVD